MLCYVAKSEDPEREIHMRPYYSRPGSTTKTLCGRGPSNWYDDWPGPGQLYQVTCATCIGIAEKPGGDWEVDTGVSYFTSLPTVGE